METRSNHVLVGGVVLALVAALAAFTVWLAGLSGGTQKEYDILFKQSVDGLAKGTLVSYSGVPSGQVTDIKLLKDNPEFVRVRIAVRADTPVVQGTTATIQSVSFTSPPQIQLDGGVKGAPPITDLGPEGVPIIPTKPGALGELLNNAPLLLERISTLTERLTELLNDDNQKSIAGILKNVDRLTGTLADQGPNIAATLNEARVTLKQAGIAADQLAKLAGTTNQLLDSDGRPLIADLRKTLASAQSTLDTLDGTLKDARPGVQSFSRQTLPELGLLVRDLRVMAEALTGVAAKLDQGGAGALLGAPQLPDYKPKGQ